MTGVDELKYVVFNRNEFYKLVKDFGIDLGERMSILLAETELPDAVVIRRRDKFASPCLLTYATMMAMVAEQHPNRKKREELLAIADYFHQQGVLAGEEGCHLPTL
jgi:hypothetical protein